METSEEVFKPPALPASASATQHVAFKMPQSKKLADSTPTTAEGSNENKIASISSPTLETERENAEGKTEAACNSKPTTIESTYKPPAWSGPCSNGNYDLDILKDGRIVGNIALAAVGDDSEQNKPYYMFGRQADVVVEHPSISRHHAVIQYRALGNPHELGWYLYDMGSTHGTYLNKEKIPPFMFVPVRVGHMFKLGFSTRMYILNGPDEDREPESNMTISEIKEQAQKQKLVMSKRREQALVSSKDDGEIEKPKDVMEEESAEHKISQADGADSGVTWGMSDNYGEDEEKEKEVEDEEEVEASESAMETIEEIQKREQLYTDDPKKALKNFFDRQECGDEMQYVYTERGAGARHQWTCRIELPIETETGRPVFAEATVSGGKKEATVACALEACRLLDAAGLLRKSSQDSKKRKSKEWAENDYYDSDEDTFLDRTGEVERKRAKRMRQAAAASDETSKQSVETYDTLSEKLKDVNAKIDRVQQQIDLIKAEAAQEDMQKSTETSSNRDSIDAFMATMSRRDAQDAKVQQSRLRLTLIELKKSAERLEKLVKLAKPASLPPVVIKKTLDTTKKQPILIGTMKGHRMRKLIVAPETEKEVPSNRSQVGLTEEDVIEVEESDETPVSKFEKKEEISERIPIVQEKSDVFSKEDVRNSTSASKKISDDVAPKVYTVPAPTGSLDNPKMDESESEIQKSPTKRQQQKKNKNKPKQSEKEGFDEYDPSDINYATWLPPENQSGDGRTSLNEKFGY